MPNLTAVQKKFTVYTTLTFKLDINSKVELYDFMIHTNKVYLICPVLSGLRLGI